MKRLFLSLTAVLLMTMGASTAMAFSHPIIAVANAQCLDKDLTLAPLFPAEGDAYVISPLVAGISLPWLTRSNNIAYYESGAWTFYDPGNGVIVYLVDENAFYERDTAITTGILGGLGYRKLTQTDLNDLHNQPIFSGEATFPSTAPVTATQVRSWLLTNNYLIPR